MTNIDSESLVPYRFPAMKLVFSYFFYFFAGAALGFSAAYSYLFLLPGVLFLIVALFIHGSIAVYILSVFIISKIRKKALGRSPLTTEVLMFFVTFIFTGYFFSWNRADLHCYEIAKQCKAQKLGLIGCKDMSGPKGLRWAYPWQCKCGDSPSNDFGVCTFSKVVDPSPLKPRPKDNL